MKTNYYKIGACIASVLLVNSAFADNSTARLATYKDNALLPQNTAIEGLGDVTAEKSVIFDMSQKSWGSGIGIFSGTSIAARTSEFDSMTQDDVSAYAWGEDADRDARFALYLSDIMQGNITPSAESGYDKAWINGEYIYTCLHNGLAVNLTGWNTSSMNLFNLDFSKASGLIHGMISSANTYRNIKLSSIQFDTVKSELRSGTYIYVDGLKTQVPWNDKTD